MKKILFTMAALSLAALVSAQEFDFGGDFGDGDDFGGTDGFGADFGSYDGAASAVTVSGEVGADARLWPGAADRESGKHDTRSHSAGRSSVDAGAYARLELGYQGDRTGADIKLKLDTGTIKDYPEDVIDEAYASGSFAEGKFQLKAGKLKEVWGKGDKIHVLDNFNANDYTDFIFPDYIDRRLGEVMLKATANLSWDYNLKLEGIITPWMTADRFASDGMLVPYRQRKLEGTVRGILAAQGAAAADSAISGGSSSLVGAIMGLSDFSTDDLYEDNIRSLKYGQAGARLTGTLGGIDLGASYYYGHYKQPSANLERTIRYNYFKKAAESGLPGMDEAAKNALQDALPSLDYDRLQVFGLEAAFVLWKLNTRWEAAYNLTDDVAGDNPWIKNNSVSWVAGFDIDLPLHNLNLNVQETGSVILNSGKIKDMGRGIRVGGATVPWSKIGNYDVDYNSDGKYTRNKLIVLLSDKFLNEKLTVEAQGIWGIECSEFVIVPKISYNVTEGLTFTAKGAYIYSKNENGEFYNFTEDSEHHDKAFVQLSVKYQF